MQILVFSYGINIRVEEEERKKESKQVVKIINGPIDFNQNELLACARDI